MATKKQIATETEVESGDKSTVDILINCSYNINIGGKVYYRQFKQGETVKIDPDLKIPFDGDKVSQAMAAELISNKQGA
jgi:hypothetical protein